MGEPAARVVGPAVVAACIAHAGWAIPRRILLTHEHAVVGLRRDVRGWQVFSRARGWQPVRLCRDSVALPALVVLRFVRAGRWLGRANVCRVMRWGLMSTGVCGCG